MDSVIDTTQLEKDLDMKEAMMKKFKDDFEKEF